MHVPEPERSVFSFRCFHLSLIPSLYLSVCMVLLLSVPSGTLNTRIQLDYTCDLTTETPKLQGLVEINVAMGPPKYAGHNKSQYLIVIVFFFLIAFRALMTSEITALNLEESNFLLSFSPCKYWKESHVEVWLYYTKCINVFQQVTVKGRITFSQKVC